MAFDFSADPLALPAFLPELEACSSVRSLLAHCFSQSLNLASVPWIDGPHLALRAARSSADAEVVVPRAGLAMPGRLDPLVRVMLMARELRLAQTLRRDLRCQFADEEPRDPGVLKLDAPTGRARPVDGVIPDPYCLGSRGYLLFRQAYASAPPPAWRQRRPVALWRGATTGSHAITPRRLPQNLRYRLCAHSLRWPDRLDARFTSVVQCRDGEAQQAVTAELVRLGLMAPVLEPLQMAQCRWIVDIDGNVNSWGLLWKLLSGSCVLRVSSDRGQWFHHRLRPGHHLVLIRSDLADLEQQLDWCWANPASCEAIAAAGQRLALEVLEDLGVDLLSALRWSLG